MTWGTFSSRMSSLFEGGGVCNLGSDTRNTSFLQQWMGHREGQLNLLAANMTHILS